MIVITNPNPIAHEINTIHSLFENGLQLLHIRKPDFSQVEMRFFLSGIKPDFRQQLVLHSHHHLAPVFGIDSIHFSENFRVSNNLVGVSNRERVKVKKSTSVHTIEDFNNLEAKFDYVFLSPIYPSISKPGYMSKINHLEAIKQRMNFSTKLVALGGISSKNIQHTLAAGFDDVALLGSIWNSLTPLEYFKKCQKIAHSY